MKSENWPPVKVEDCPRIVLQVGRRYYASRTGIYIFHGRLLAFCAGDTALFLDENDRRPTLVARTDILAEIPRRGFLARLFNL